MRLKKLYITLGLLFLSSVMMAEVIILYSGKEVVGEVLLQNDEVVILRTAAGLRYQYPRNEVMTIRMDEIVYEEKAETSPVLVKKHSVEVRLQACAGPVYAPFLGWGGYAGADLLIGAKVTNEKRIFVGGEIGYRAKIMGNKTYSYIPLQVVVSSILTDAAHAPIVGVNIGYGISTNRTLARGGICVGADVGWHYTISESIGLSLSVMAELQQTQTEIEEIIFNPSTGLENKYSNYVGLNFLSFGAKFSLHL